MPIGMGGGERKMAFQDGYEVQVIDISEESTKAASAVIDPEDILKDSEVLLDEKLLPRACVWSDNWSP